MKKWFVGEFNVMLLLPFPMRVLFWLVDVGWGRERARHVLAEKKRCKRGKSSLLEQSIISIKVPYRHVLGTQHSDVAIQQYRLVRSASTFVLGGAANKKNQLPRARGNRIY